MAKRQSTLFNYFTSPKVSKNEDKTKETEESPIKEKQCLSKKRQREEKDNDLNNSLTGPPTKRVQGPPTKKLQGPPIKKVQKSSSESEAENCSPNKVKKGKSRIIRPLDSSSDSDSDDQQGKENGAKNNLKKFSFKKAQDVSSTTTPVKSKASAIPKEKPSIKDIHTSWVHNSLEFLHPDKIMDINKRKPTDPKYDSRTLYVPDKFLFGLTPAMRQWWDLKSHHMDSVLFFKVGKFYELYHMDAVVGVTQLGFSYMKGEFAHSGFPETAYAKMASALIEKGYKVARVEQTETPEMMAERIKATKSTSKFDKVVKREVCQVSLKGACVYTAQMSESPNESPNYMYALSMQEKLYGTVRIGVCFVETSIGTFHLSEFDEDKHFSRLLALFAEYPPALILTEKGGIVKQLRELLSCNFKDIKQETLLSKTQFHAAPETLEKLSTACYFRNSNGEFQWPDIFKKIADDCMPKNDYQLTIRCIGACMWYLKDSKTDIQVFSIGKFEWYDPLEFSGKDKHNRDYLLLDATTIHNLDLIESKMSLKQVLNYCETAFGKRLLMRWICRPLCNVQKIQERQHAVTYLWDHTDLLSSTQAILKKLPDLERLLTKIHTFGNKFLTTDHPDGRAIFYEAKTYSTKKIKDFLKTLRSFEKAQEITHLFKDCDDRFLRKITQVEPKGINIDLSEILTHFKTAFDQEEAEKEGKIIPRKGIVEEYDDIEYTINEINKQLNDYLEKQCQFFGCKVSYVGNDKKRFQLEVPENKSNIATDEYFLEGARKGTKPVKKFSTPTTRELLAKLKEAETEKAKIIRDLNRKIFENFSTNQDKFDRVIQCLTILDVLCSLAEYAKRYAHDICLPKILPFADEPKIVMENARHPCIPNLDTFVPNDIKLGVDDNANIMVLTGPNMGGKSTLMRQVAVIVIMAQIGSFVPALSCELNLHDRIFTRLGAEDDILKGQSTFYVELSEASIILKHASRHSLVIIDELGRGTSTHDGTAIATAYVKELTEIKCRTMFSTHYHSLVNNFRDSIDVQLTHMACMVEKDEDPTQESVTFLYKLAKGVCPKSYGFNAAKLAGLERNIITRGKGIATDLEENIQHRNAFNLAFNCDDKANVSLIREALKELIINF